MREGVEVNISPAVAKRREEAETPAISAPPFQLECPSMSRSPLLDIGRPKTPRSPYASRLMTPIASPMKKAITRCKVAWKKLATSPSLTHRTPGFPSPSPGTATPSTQHFIRYARESAFKPLFFPYLSLHSAGKY
jgi:hypothetical protein